MSNATLILTFPTDGDAFAIATAMGDKGADVTLWQTSDFPSRSRETLVLDSRGARLSARSGDMCLPAKRWDVVWNRRPVHVGIGLEALHPADQEFARRQAVAFRTAVFSLIASDAVWVNPYQASVRSAHKPIQHAAALAAGLETVSTLYSNDPDAIREFLRAHGGEVVYKQVKSVPCGWVDGETVWGLSTSLVRARDLPSDDVLAAVPGLYQRRLDKAYELRIVAMGRQLFTAKFHSQQTADGRLDVRRAGDDLRSEAIDTPAHLREPIHKIMKELDLVFGCFDFVVAPDGTHYFLEVNEMGQFLYLERWIGDGFPLLDAFTDFLFEPSLEFMWRPRGPRTALSRVRERVEAEAAGAAMRHAEMPVLGYREDAPRRPATKERARRG